MADTNGSSSRRPLRHGIMAPTMTFFNKETEDVDVQTIKKHAIRLAKAGLVGLVTMGSNGEAVHLTREEKTLVTRATREALDEAGFHDIPVIAGCSENSVRLTVELCKEAAAAGADYALILPPAHVTSSVVEEGKSLIVPYRYYRAQVNDNMIFDYYTAVAAQSPIPIMLYNYPGAVSGVDMDSDMMIRLAEATKHKVCGAKFTCGATGKLNRVAAATNAVSVKGAGSGWMACGGVADFTVQTAVAGGSGMIVGTANVMPKLCVKVWNLWASGDYEKAMEMQKVLSRADWALTKSAAPGTKAAIELEFGYGGYSRRPLPRLSEEELKKMKEAIREGMEIENSL